MTRHAWRNWMLCAAVLATLPAGCSSWSGSSSDPNAPLALYPWPGQPAVAGPGYAPPAVPAAPVAVQPAAVQPPPATVAAAPQPIVRAQNGAYGGWPVQPVSPDARTTQVPASGGGPASGPYTAYQGGAPGTPGAPVAPGAAPANGIPAQPVSMMGPFDYSIPSETPPNAPTGDPYIDLEAYAEETQTGKFQIGAAVNSDAGLVGQIVLDEQNFDLFRWPSSWEDIRNGTAWRGAGQRFRLEAMPGTDVQRYVVSFTEPYFLNSPFSLSLSGSYFDRVYTDWTETRAGGRVSVGYQFPEVPDLSTALSFRGERVTISNENTSVTMVDPSQQNEFDKYTEMKGSNDLFGFGLTVKHDTRDHAFLPTQGHLVEVGGEFVTGTFDYPRATLDARQYFVTGERPDGSGRHVIALSGKLGFSGPDTPTYENFFAGGFSTMRGFDFRGASPRIFQLGSPATNIVVGGPFEMLGSVEYMFPITADDNLRGVVFTDFGTVEQDVRIDPNTFRVSVGFGLRIVLAQALGPAPIALDFAVPVAHAAGDDIQNFSFFVGYSR